ALLLDASALLHADTGGGRLAAADLLTSLALARSLAAEPALLSQRVRVATLSSAVTALELVMNRTVLPDASLSELATALQRLEADEQRGDAFHRALVGERVNAMTVLAAPQPFLQTLSDSVGGGLPADERQRWIDALR